VTRQRRAGGANPPVGDPVQRPTLLPPLEEHVEWQARALCAETDPEVFFPENGGSTRAAKTVCRACEVRTTCLTYALAHGERFGVWGGLSERERRQLNKTAPDSDIGDAVA
jgi:WhiB family transcriptional regulator, redox-sensing transcriptional regulator